MNRDKLIELFESLNSGYIWELYYFTIDKRKNNVYTTYKVKFRQDSYLDDYANNLIASVKNFQLSTIVDVQDYNGENTKISCDQLRLDDPIIKDKWDDFYESLLTSSEDKCKKVHGYLLTGKPTRSEGKSITLFKVGNPVIKLSNNKAHFYLCINDELAAVTDDYCKLYLSADFFIYDSVLYTFNLKFEQIFDIEKTMKNIKDKRIEEILMTNLVSNEDKFKLFAQRYKSPKTFITLTEDRINILKDDVRRKEIAQRFGFELDKNNKFIFEDEEKASLFIRYLCYKVFEEANTHDVIEASNVTKLSI